jgi:hypothetical protein
MIILYRELFFVSKISTKLYITLQFNYMDIKHISKHFTYYIKNYQLELASNYFVNKSIYN